MIVFSKPCYLSISSQNTMAETAQLHQHHHRHFNTRHVSHYKDCQVMFVGTRNKREHSPVSNTSSDDDVEYVRVKKLTRRRAERSLSSSGRILHEAKPTGEPDAK